jgi:phosphatidylinositol phospholipase C delta
MIQVEYYPTDVTGTGGVDHDLGSEEEKKEEENERERDDETGLPPDYKPAHICEELAVLGYYARSMKPPKGWLSQRESFPIFG